MISYGATRIFGASLGLAFSAMAALAQQPAPAPAQQAAPEIPFDSIPDPLKLPPNMYFGEATGVAVNSKKHVFVFSRGNTSGPAYAAGAAQLLEFGPDGRFIREIGKNLYAWSFAHAVRIDRQDNIWAIDKGSDMIIRFNPEGRVTMVFGRKQEASDESTKPLEHPVPPLPSEDGRFRQPTDVAFGPDGSIFISDGYINPASPRPTRTATGSSHGAIAAINRASSTRRTASQPMRRATSTSRTAAMGGSRFSTARASSCAS